MATVEPVEHAEPVGTPKHLWVVGILSLLWNAFGGYDYTMTQLRDPAYFASVSGQMGMSVAEMNAFFDTFPVWASALWAIGVWGSVLGSILLLMRSRHAATAFLVSLLMQIASFGGQTLFASRGSFPVPCAARGALLFFGRFLAT